MRVEPFVVGSYVHCMKRGGRGMPIVNSDADRWRFVRSLYYLNDTFFHEDWDQLTRKVSQTNPLSAKGNTLFHRPDDWPRKDPLVKILSYILMPNHLHLLLREIRKGGIATFMQKLGQSMTNHFNEKYKSKGSLFQGSYKGRIIKSDSHLRYVPAYIMVKNGFELLGGGLDKARKDFETSWKHSVNYPFSSLADYAGNSKSPIIDKDILSKLFESPKAFKTFARDVVEGGKWEKDKKYKNITME